MTSRTRKTNCWLLLFLTKGWGEGTFISKTNTQIKNNLPKLLVPPSKEQSTAADSHLLQLQDVGSQVPSSNEYVRVTLYFQAGKFSWLMIENNSSLIPGVIQLHSLTTDLFCLFRVLIQDLVMCLTVIIIKDSHQNIENTPGEHERPNQGGASPSGVHRLQISFVSAFKSSTLSTVERQSKRRLMGNTEVKRAKKFKENKKNTF